MDDMMRETAEGLDALELIEQEVAGISDDEIEARLQWTLAAHQIGRGSYPGGAAWRPDDGGNRARWLTRAVMALTSARCCRRR